MKRKVLIVDDDPQVVALASKVVETLGHEVISFTDPKQAQSFFAEHRVDLALVDLVMPEVDGFEMTRWLREENPFTRVINMTGFAPVNTLLACWRIGADCCVLKGRDFVPQLKEAITASLQATDRWERSVDVVRKSGRTSSPAQA